MIALANDPTAAAVLAAAPCYPVPPSGSSPAIDALRGARSGQGLAVGRDRVMLILRRPWLALDVALSGPLPAYLPYGSVGGERLDLLCGLIPGAWRDVILDHLRAALPDEAAAFVLWHDETRSFCVEFPDIEEATPSRLVYRPPVLAPGWHLVLDVHSHGAAPAFFSATDNTDDAHATKIAIVFGGLDDPAGPTSAARLCAGGMFLPMPRSPFAGDDHVG